MGYRSRVVTMARTLDLKGYVKNLADDRVLVVAEGERPDLERFCRAIRLEDPLIKVEDMQVKLSEVKGLRLDLKDCALARHSKRKVNPVESPIDIISRMRQKPS